ncbi:Homeodomain-like domain-containing protein [Pseudonocardia sediminis]|uniref:Homeodomain-like domain-containing protein n=1 Tax=Pseudonocardia sediminis TaxID=1397368 RepID=A0A4Q7U7P7_PSEST|nr:WhiB family transcriptional regulator [Pseudonocardia sediminis]RZT75518.1 Homeodomain-like domain-containing protein [Pseudonocardia sediminis]
MPIPSSSIDTRPAPEPTDASPDWRHGAACRQVTPETFFPAAENGDSYDEQVTAAKAICHTCPVLKQCRAWSLLHLAYGVAGGLTERERSTLRRRQRRAHPRAAAAAHVAPVGEVAATATRRERRAAAVRYLAESRTSRDRAARQFHVSIRTIDRWLAEARASA